MLVSFGTSDNLDYAQNYGSPDTCKTVLMRNIRATHIHLWLSIKTYENVSDFDNTVPDGIYYQAGSIF